MIPLWMVRAVIDRLVVSPSGMLLFVVATRSDLYGDNDE